MLARGILGSGRTGSVSSRPFPNSSGWWWLISSVFLIRISCHKTTHANGYYGAWPGWAVSISVLPLTTWVNLVWGKEIQNQFSIISTFVLLLLVFLVRLLWIFIKSGFISCKNPPHGGNGNPLQYSCLENPMDRILVGYIQSMGLQRVRHDRAQARMKRWGSKQKSVQGYLLLTCDPRNQREFV